MVDKVAVDELIDEIDSYLTERAFAPLPTRRSRLLPCRTIARTDHAAVTAMTAPTNEWNWASGLALTHPQE